MGADSYRAEDVQNRPDSVYKVAVSDALSSKCLYYFFTCMNYPSLLNSPLNMHVHGQNRLLAETVIANLAAV